jgi:hypothetical protein
MTANNGADAVSNARDVANYDVGMCLKYVRAEAWEIGSLYGDAIDAWYGAVDRHPGDRTPPLGAPMFYEGGNHGHIVVCVKADTESMRSTDMPSSGKISENDLDWPVNNWGVKYLGWTGDLNSVDLPLGDEMNSDDWAKLRDIVRDEVKANNDAAAERVWNEELEATKADGTKKKMSTRQTLREVWNKIAKAEAG